MTEREAVIEKFLAARGWGGAARTTLAGDASFRRYHRLTDTGRGAVLIARWMAMHPGTDLAGTDVDSRPN